MGTASSAICHLLSLPHAVPHLPPRLYRSGSRPDSGHRAPSPTPRPASDPAAGVTAAKVLTAAQLAKTPHAIEYFDMVRQIPQVVDGLRCHCGCAEIEGFYSLLSCYEGDGMASYCEICEGEGRMAYRLHQEGKTLDDIRAAIDARYG